MRFDGFLGNEALRTRLSAAAQGGKLSHAWLLCGPQGSGKHTLGRILAAAMECEGQGEAPCGVCLPCRKVFAAMHPDVITVDDEDHKNVAVEVIRNARTDVFTRPNEGRRKVYIIPRGQDLGPASQNALLKILEEPPAYAAFLIFTENADKLLPTIRSRCAELHMAPLTRAEAIPALRARRPEEPEEALLAAHARSGGFLGQALTLLDQGVHTQQTQDFARAYGSGDRLEILSVLLRLEKYKRDALLPILEEWRGLFCDALQAKNGLPAASKEAAALCQNRTGAQLLQAANDLASAMDDLNQNVGAGPVIGWLCTRLR